MSKQQRQNAPEAPKATGVVEKPPEQTNVEPPASAAPEAPKATGDGVAAPEGEQATASEAVATANESSVETKLDTIASSLDSIRSSLDSIGSEESERECPACVALNGERPCSLACFVAAGYEPNAYEQMFGAPPPKATLVDPSRNGKPPPDGSVIVRALVGCVVRVQHRHPGEVFWMLKSRPDDGGHHLGEYADEFAIRGDVEIL